MDALIKLIGEREAWLMHRILGYAKKQGYVRYTSTMVEAWRQSISGLSEAFMMALAKGECLEFTPEETFQNDSVSAFGVLEAQKHRSRGITLGMFMGLMKYYRQAYWDLVTHHVAGADQGVYLHAVQRFFDRVELAFCCEWCQVGDRELLDDLQDKNRVMTNEKNKFLTIFESMHVPAAFLDIDDHIVHVNYAWQNFFLGEKAPGASYYDSQQVSHLVPLWLMDILHKAALHDEFLFEKQVETLLGTRFFQIKIKRMLDVSDKFQGRLVVLNDITSRREAEQELELARENLQKRVDAQTAELLEANAMLAQEIAERKRMEASLIKLERLRAQEDVAQGISHNLNNILTGVQFPAQFIQTLTDDARILEYAELIVRGSERAAGVVKRLQKAMGGKNKLQKLEAVNTQDIVEEVIEETRPRWETALAQRGRVINIVTRFEDVPCIWGTVSEFHDIVLNLIMNAIDALPNGGTICIETSRRDDRVCLSVSDDGLGMSEETLKRIFEPFFTTKADVGSGLGLASIYGTVTQWNGVVEVESELGKGSTFYICLPVASGEDWHGERIHRKMKLLLVEDDLQTSKLLMELLKPDYDVLLAQDGQEALDIFQSQGCDIALIDFSIPVYSGDVVARAMRKEGSQTVTVLITGWVLEPDDVRLLDFDFFIQKPLSPRKVQETLVRARALIGERAGVV